MSIDTKSLSPIPGWQIALVLVGFPLLYILNSFAPWSTALFGRQDRSYWFIFWISVLLLHWLSAGLTIYFVRKSGNTLSDIGWMVTPTKLAILATSLIALGAAMVYVRQTMSTTSAPPSHIPDWLIAFYPHTLPERCLWVVLSLSAGFCEEVVYRGFGITALRQRGCQLWQAVALATVSFVFVHGIAGLFGFPIYFVLGLFFAGVFLWRKSLIPGMVIHAIFDLNAIFAL